jgi:peroxiredoxin
VSRAGPWLLAAAIGAAVGFALWQGSSVPDPVDRGARAPDFVLPRIGGDGELALDDLRGRVVLLNFWATWCKPCEEEMPAMQRLQSALAAEGLALVAVSVDEEREPVEAFRTRLGLDFTLLWDPGQRVSRLYQAYRFPETLLIDRDGRVVERYIGPRDWDAPLYVERIRRLLDG